MTIFSPRASTMAHHIGDEAVSRAWSEKCNNLIKRACDLFPDTFYGGCMLPQSPEAGLEGPVAELDRCVNERGFVSLALADMLKQPALDGLS